MKLKNSVGRDEYISIDTSTILYHVASATNLPSILEQGILPADSTHRDNLETKLSHIAADHGIEFPVVRQDCVFCYPSIDIALMGIHPDTECDNSLISHSGIVLVDAASTETNLYMGEFRYISDAIDFQYMVRPDEAMISQSFEDALARYAKSFTEIENISQIENISEQFHTPEVVIEGGVKPSAITECIFWKQLHTQGLPQPVRAGGIEEKGLSRRSRIEEKYRNGNCR
ncbi:hypothetical protein halTADL_1488 [Halohasta litchfieldiae]|jgi:hypothetical protein|uniref:Uncharacterized protein n=1 Tax=Halohasta litchfieldiae TaxID=1073996 RepID=A0A1H6VQU2_9EURY|nr:hypothetical protein [Halohasta litchfieldiae]ATW88253.1 hypothetical protein halTADL_1488 [Halohasta litchfieldiae]SEJ06993.1 hypothetical protein SAMN05444271_11925 [Halohasta litchfieldiae]